MKGLHEVRNWVNQTKPNGLVQELKTETEIITNTNEKMSELYHFWNKLCSSSTVDNLKRFQLLRHFKKAISDEEIENRERPITRYDIERSIFKLRRNTNPGPDGLTAEFSENHRKSFARLLLPTFRETMEGKTITGAFSTSITRLLPKQCGFEEGKNFRSISLINTDCIILSHVPANRIKQLPNIVHIHQYAYIKDRKIHSTIWDAKQRRIENGSDWCLVGIDCTKACDRVDRTYMFQVLKKMKFPESLVNIIEKR